MHSGNIENYNFIHGLHRNLINGKWFPLHPHTLGRALTHDEMDYNLLYNQQTVAGWRIFGLNEDLSLSDDEIGKSLIFHKIKITDTDYDRYVAAGYSEGHYIWITPIYDCSEFYVSGTSNTNSTVRDCSAFIITLSETSPSIDSCDIFGVNSTGTSNSNTDAPSSGSGGGSGPSPTTPPNSGSGSGSGSGGGSGPTPTATPNSGSGSGSGGGSGPTPTATPVPTVIPTATPVPTSVPTATPVPTAIPTATPVPTSVPTATPAPIASRIYYFHLGTNQYPWGRDLINDQLFKADDSIAANYSESFEDMLANPASYETVGELAELVDGTTFTMPASITANFYWIAIPTSAGIPDLTVNPKIEISGAPADICSDKLNFVRDNGEEYTLYKLNTVPTAGSVDIKYVN
jgi:hypothetical protein